jgi:hypothetical protein
VTHAAKPRALVLIVMRGGIDAVLSTSPKRATEVDASVDIPYGDGDIFERGGSRFGPHLAPLAEHLGAFAIVNNVQVATVRHETGEPQLTRLRIAANTATPTLADVIGWYRQGPPLGAVQLGGRLWYQPSSGMLDCTAARTNSGDAKDLCDTLLAMPPAELEASAEALDKLARSSDNALETRRHATDVAALMRKLGTTPALAIEKWAEETNPDERLFMGAPQVRWLERDFQRALWMIEHELVACINISCRELEWDSHVNNLDWQTKMNRTFFPLVARFMAELGRRSNRHGTLADQTMVVMGSELGRHPTINDHKGKDHFPETPMFFAGPNIKRGAVYGATGRRMEGLPIDPETGRADKRGFVPTLDDIGASVVRGFGIDPIAHGYTGRHLPFLVDA